MGAWKREKPAKGKSGRKPAGGGATSKRAAPAVDEGDTKGQEAG